MAVCSFMYTMSMVKTDSVRLSKHQNTSHSLTPQISRVCFTSASKYSKGQHVAGDDRRREFSACNAAESAEETNAAGDALKDAMDQTKQQVGEILDKAKDNAEYLKEQASDAASKVGDKVEETKDWAMDAAQDTDKKNKENFGSIVDKASDVREDAMKNAEKFADKTKGYSQDAKEKTEGGGETVSQKGTGAWDAAEEEAKKVKEAVE